MGGHSEPPEGFAKGGEESSLFIILNLAGFYVRILPMNGNFSQGLAVMIRIWQA